MQVNNYVMQNCSFDYDNFTDILGEQGNKETGRLKLPISTSIITS